MREIEIKVQITDSEDTIQKLHKAGIVLSAPKTQHDVVYCLPSDLDGGHTAETNWLRIRTVDETAVFFTLKQSMTGSLDSIEHETTVGSGAELATILSYLGYVVYGDLTKTRRTGHYGDTIEICLDEVPPLGSFIELEKLCQPDVVAFEVENELVAVLDTLGIDRAQRITLGYDELMNEHLANGGVR